MAKYKYTFMRTDRELGVGVETDEPLPHIAIGNRLVIENIHVSQDGGTFLRIRDVEMMLEAYEPPAVRVQHIVVYVEPASSVHD